MIIFLEEKKGGIPISDKALRNFQDFVQGNLIMDMQTRNGIFTWSNRHRDNFFLVERLDIFLLGDEWKNTNLSVKSKILPLIKLDHSLIQLTFSLDYNSMCFPFKFEKIWLKDKDLETNMMEKFPLH